MTRLIALLLTAAGLMLSLSVAAQNTVTTPVVPAVSPAVAPAVTPAMAPAAPAAPAVAAAAAPKAESAAAPKAEKKSQKAQKQKEKKQEVQGLIAAGRLGLTGSPQFARQAPSARAARPQRASA